MTEKNPKTQGWSFALIFDLVVAFVMIQIFGLAPALAMYAAHSLLKGRLGYVLSLLLSVGIGIAVFLGLVALLSPEEGGV